MSAELVGVVVYDSVLFDVGHNIRRWAEAVETRFTANAVALAPINSRPNKSNWYPDWPVGGLKMGIHGEVSKVGPKILQTLIHSDAPYSIYVIEGTGTIFPHGNHLRLPNNAAYGGRVTLHKWVSGQSAKNFLAAAHDATAARHPSLRRGGIPFRQW